ncbi:hypothetical protein L3Q67_32230 [Saccharothrix sp. AJ9571]|nr:hypothetical protein L3Q67_32230 [Saccharothrix sp. AJ9571]
MNEHFDQTGERRHATDIALRIIAANGTGAQQATAKDVLEGRHRLQDLLYLPDHSGTRFAPLYQLAQPWTVMSADQRAELMRDADTAVADIVSRVAAIELPQADRDHQHGEPDDVDFSEITFCVPAVELHRHDDREPR